MMFDDDDDLPLPDQFLTQLDMIESQAMATLNMEIDNGNNECIKSENVVDGNPKVFEEVANLKHTIEDYKRQIERLQDHEMSLHGEATMLRQRLDTKQKEAEAARMDKFKSIDQLTQDHKRKVDELNQQIRSLRSQVQFAEHELHQSRRASLDNSMVVAATQQKTPRAQQGIGQYFDVPNSSSKPTPVLKSVVTNEASVAKVVESHRKWFLRRENTSFTSNNTATQRHLFGICCGGSRTVTVVCPVAKRSFICDLLSSSSPKNIIRVLNHVKLMMDTNELSQGESNSAEKLSNFFDLIARFLFLNTQANGFYSYDKIDKDRITATAELVENACEFLANATVLKHAISEKTIHCSVLRLVASMFIALPKASKPSIDTTIDDDAGCFVSSNNSNGHQLHVVLRRLFEQVLLSLLTPASLEQCTLVSKLQNPSNNHTHQFNSIFPYALEALKASSCYFNVIDLRSRLADCPLLSTASAFQSCFNGFSLSTSIPRCQRSTCLNFVRLLTNTVTLSIGAIDRFLLHPCHCQPVVLGVLATIGLSSLNDLGSSSLALSLLPEAQLLDSVLNVLLIIESQQPIQTDSHLPVFYLFLAKLSESLIRESHFIKPGNKMSENRRISAVQQLLRHHDIILPQ